MRSLPLLFLLICSSLFAQVDFRIDSLGQWQSDKYNHTGTHSIYNEVWGFEKNGKEYAVLGSKKGIHIIDVTDPSDLLEVMFIEGRFSNATHRDFHDFNGYLYMVCDQFPSSLKILDIRGLPESWELVYDLDYLFSTTHNIFIDTVGQKLYACSAHDIDSTYYDLKIFDLSKSHIPDLLIGYNDVNDEIAGFHDIWVRDNFGIGNNGGNGLFLYDFNADDTVSIIGQMTSYPDKGYNHAGYATEDNRYYYFSDETHGKDLKAVDISEPKDPQVVSIFNSGRNDDKTVPHNLIVHDSLLYVSYYHEGLQVYSLKDPAKPKKIAHYLTYTDVLDPIAGEEEEINYSGYRGAWGVYPFLPSGNILISDREKGLMVFKINFEGIDPKEIDADYKTIFPNPSSDDFYIDYRAEKIVSLNIYDVQGRTVESGVKFKGESGHSRIYPSAYLGAGVYVLEVIAKDEVFTLKISRD